MSKIIPDTHITGEAGVNAFATYCNRHDPYIIWREETRNDFGIDGEVELTARDNNGKRVATGEIIKVQIKSTKSGGYIKRDSETHFEFVAKSSDVDYWTKHVTGVLLVVYFEDQDQLFIRKIEDIDLAKSKKSIPIEFDKIQNRLISGETNFHERYAKYLKSRVSFEAQETISINLLKFTTLPRVVFEYPSKVSQFSEVQDELDRALIPPVILHGKSFYSFNKPDSYKEFCEKFIGDKPVKTHHLKTFIEDENNRRQVSRLINMYFRDYCRDLRIYFNAEYHRYYFGADIENDDRTQGYKSRRSTDKLEHKTVVKMMDYYGTQCYRHHGFEFILHYLDDGIYASIIPKILITSDKREPLDDPKLVTKLTNYITIRQTNQIYQTDLNFVFAVLSKNRGHIVLADYDNARLKLGRFVTNKVQFGIYGDQNRGVGRDNEDETQLTLEL